MELVEVCKTSEIKAGILKSVDVEGVKLMATIIDGDYIVASRICTHKTYDLSTSHYIDGYVTCKLHTSVFDLGDEGGAMNPPAVEPLDMFEAIVKDNTLFIKI